MFCRLVVRSSFWWNDPAWQSTAVIDGTLRTWLGVDRFRLANGMAVEEHVIFDSAALQPAG